MFHTSTNVFTEISWIHNSGLLWPEKLGRPCFPSSALCGVSFSSGRARHQLHRLPPCCQNSTGIYEQLLGVRLSCVWSHKTWTWLTPRSLCSYHKPSIHKGRRRLMLPPSCPPCFPPGSAWSPLNQTSEATGRRDSRWRFDLLFDFTCEIQFSHQGDEPEEGDLKQIQSAEVRLSNGDDFQCEDKAGRLSSCGSWTHKHSGIVTDHNVRYALKSSCPLWLPSVLLVPRWEASSSLL